MTDFPDVLTPEITLAFQALCEAIDTAAKARSVTLCDVAVTWHAHHGGKSGFYSIFSESMTMAVAEGMAGVLLMDADDADFEDVVPMVTRQ
jgi:hypothetical protein